MVWLVVDKRIDAHGDRQFFILKHIILHGARRRIIIMDLTGVPTPKIDLESTNLPEQSKTFQPADDRKKLEPYYKQFKVHVQPKLNPIFDWFKFNNYVQGAQPV